MANRRTRGMAILKSKKPSLLNLAKCLKLLAPRPGLEPWTYGLTVERCHFLMALSSKNSNGYFDGFPGRLMPPNL